jgi:hypothetical protein
MCWTLLIERKIPVGGKGKRMLENLAGRVENRRRIHGLSKGGPLGVGFECLAQTLQKGTPFMTSTKYSGMDVHQEIILIAAMNSVGKVVMECVIETKASTILQFIHGLRGDLHVTFEVST